MKSRRLVVFVLALVGSVGVMALGPYRELSARSPLGPPLDEAPRATASEVAAYLVSIGPDGIDLYRRHFWWDLAFLVCNALVLLVPTRVALERAAAIRRVTRATKNGAVAGDRESDVSGRVREPLDHALRGRDRLLLAFAPLTALADFAENVLVQRVLDDPLTPSESLVRALRITTLAKGVAIGLAISICVGALALWGWRAWRSPRGSGSRLEGSASS